MPFTANTWSVRTGNPVAVRAVASSIGQATPSALAVPTLATDSPIALALATSSARRCWKYCSEVTPGSIGSAETLKSLKSPVRTIARSGVKITAVSQNAVASLIELQSDMITSAITAAALRLERASRADGLVDLVRDQIEMIPASRDRIVEDGKRAVHIFKVAGRDLRGVAANLYEKVVDATEEQIPEVKVAKRKVKTAVRKTKARARKVAA